MLRGIGSNWTSTLARQYLPAEIANRSVRILDSSLGRLRWRGDVQVSSYIISHSLSFYMLSISLIEVTCLTGSAGQLQVWAALGESLTAGELCRLLDNTTLALL